MKRPEEYAGDKEEKDTDYSDGQEDCGQHRHLLYHSEKNLLGLVFTYEGTEFEIIQKMISTITCLLACQDNANLSRNAATAAFNKNVPL